MTPNKHNFTSSEIQAVLPLKTWWAMLLVLPLSVRLICFVVNRTQWTPNVITVTGLLLRLITASMFLYGSHLSLMVGAVFYIASYVCDCTDGAVARLTGKTSDFGRYLDHTSDLVGDILIILCLAWSQGMLSSLWIWAMLFMHVAECYISYLMGFAVKQHKGTLGTFPLFQWYNRYRQWWFQRNIKSFVSFPDYTALIFVFFPLFGMPELGLQVGFYMLMTVVSYTIFSTFVSLHTDIKPFP